eukprot:99953-Prorocentrum_lima.AAC.1
MAGRAQEFLECQAKADIDKLAKGLLPGKKGIFELMGLCQAVAKELDNAVTSARKRIKQEQSTA